MLTALSHYETFRTIPLICLRLFRASSVFEQLERCQFLPCFVVFRNERRTPWQPSRRGKRLTAKPRTCVKIRIRAQWFFKNPLSVGHVRAQDRCPPMGWANRNGDARRPHLIRRVLTRLTLRAASPSTALLGRCQNYAGEKIHRRRSHQALPRLPKNPQTQACGSKTRAPLNLIPHEWR